MKAKDLKSAILFGNIKCNPTRYSPLLTEKTTVSPRSSPLGPGGGVLPYKSLMRMCRWMGSHFHDWSDYNGVAFSIELLEWGRKFSNFGGK